MNKLDENELREIWKKEEEIAHIKGWDFSCLNGRMEEDQDFPWDYSQLIHQYVTDDMKIMDYDTGGGEFLLSLNHPYKNTAATEGWEPNVKLCEEKLLPLGIDFRKCDDASNFPFEDEAFDVCINRHGDFDPVELRRVLKPGGLFITQQVGDRNDRDLVELVLPGTENPFPGLNMETQVKEFIKAGFEILNSDEVFKPIRFYDVGAFVWFARVIVWEFPDFSVDRCFEQLLQLQQLIEDKGFIEGTIHRYMIVARKL
jgi:hypothetical protein